MAIISDLLDYNFFLNKSNCVNITKIDWEFLNFWKCHALVFWNKWKKKNMYFTSHQLLQYIEVLCNTVHENNKDLPILRIYNFLYNTHIFQFYGFNLKFSPQLTLSIISIQGGGDVCKNHDDCFCSISIYINRILRNKQ